MNLKGVFLFCAALLVSAGAAQARTLSLPTLEANPGQTVMVDITADADVQDIHSLNLKLNYHATTSAPQLVVDNQPGDFDVPFILTGGSEHHTVSPGILTSDMSNPQGFSGPAVALRFPVTIPSNAQGGTTYVLSFSYIRARDAQNHEYVISAQNGSIKVKTLPPGPGITVSSTTGPAGGTATVSVNATANLKAAAGAQFTLLYEEELGIAKEDVQAGSFFEGNTAINVPAAGVLRYAVASSASRNGPGEIARFTFHIPANAAPGTEYIVHLAEVIVAGVGGSRSNVTTGDGKITVSGGPPTGRPVMEGGLVSVVPVAPIVRSGQIAGVNIKINDKIKNLSGVSFRLEFNTKTPSDAPDLRFAHYTPGTVLTGAAPQVNARVAGQVTVAMATSQTRSGPGTLVTLNFVVPQNAPKNCAYTLELKDLLLSIDGEDYTSASEGGVLTVNARMRGDVAGANQGDGHINTLDALELLQILIGMKTGTEEQLQAADANCDNEVTISDVVKILKRSVGLEALCGEEETVLTPG